MNDKLPIYEIEEELVSTLAAGNRLIIQAPTGSGKSTQVPQILLNRGATAGQIVILQPRRLAARMLAARVAAECSSRLGDRVGYQIRFEDRSSRETVIKFVTEGILLRQMLTDPSLSGVGTVIFDEFHERHVYSDVSLALALSLQRTARPDLKIIVMSATLDSAALSDYMSPARTIACEGRAFPVNIEHLPKPPSPDAKVWDLAAQELDRAVRESDHGDVLIFMPGSYEITKTVGALRASSAARGCQILPLHGELPPDQQDAAVARYDKRKIVVSTNVAETSLTIDGITLVIDSGLARIARFDPERGINTLFLDKISKASADQRAGRAGRTAPGLCVRLWTASDHIARPAREMPEIRRIDLAEISIALKSAGIPDISQFHWLDKPDARALERAEQLLRDLGAADKETGAITPLGRQLVAFPIHPRYARMLIAADQWRCVPTVALVAALTQDRSILLSRQGERVHELRDRKIGDSEESDFVALINAWRYAELHNYEPDACREVGVHGNGSRQVGRLIDYFLGIAKAQGLNVTDDLPAHDAVAKCILTGFSDHVACRINMGTFRCDLVHGRRADLAKESTVRKSRLLVACEVSEIGGRGRDSVVTMNLATAIQPEWLSELFHGDMREVREPVFDTATKRVTAEQRLVFRDLVLERKLGAQPTAEEAAVILAGEIISERLRIDAWDHQVEQVVNRINTLATRCPDLGIPQFTADARKAVLARFCMGAYGYKDLKSKPLLPFVLGWLAGDKRALLEKLAPERITLSNGRPARLTYPPDFQPFLALPIQSLYGVKAPVKIANGRITVVAQILAPNQRPVHITSDLPGFWTEHYPKIKQEYQRKYPKHEWR